MFRLKVFFVTSFLITCVSVMGSNDTVPEIVSRSEWGARKPVARDYMAMPVPYVILHHTDWNSCYTRENCCTEMRKIQDFHIDGRGWWDIGYTFCVGEDGRVYEGRGWNTQGAHSVWYNSRSIGICIMGTFENVLPKKAALDAVQNFIAYSIDQKKLVSNYTLYGHRQATKGTECPGQALFEHIQTWPHWKSGEHFPPAASTPAASKSGDTAR